MIIRVRVVPNSKKVSIEKTDRGLTVKVKSKAMEGAANAEVIRLISINFGCKAVVIRGSKSRDKLLQLDCNGENLENCLKKIVK